VDGTLWKPCEAVVEPMNRRLEGWAGSFHYGNRPEAMGWGEARSGGEAEGGGLVGGGAAGLAWRAGCRGSDFRIGVLRAIAKPLGTWPSFWR
jgi:hypothetical protein